VVVGPDDPDKADALDRGAVAQARAAGVLFLGMRRDVEDLYAAMDLYVLASHREGFPRSAMEAAAMGLPIVATDIRGCRQVVDHETTGLLVPVEDAVALAAAIGELASDADRRRRMGDAARAKARREFDQQHVIDITLGVYERLLAAKGRAAA
jgi:glycosyltransferase involved in cell wall biosynthesis